MVLHSPYEDGWKGAIVEVGVGRGRKGDGAKRNQAFGRLCPCKSVCARACASACIDVPTEPSYQKAASVWHVGEAIAPLLCCKKRKEKAAEPSESEFSHQDGKD